MKFLMLASINKKHETLRYVTFKYTKSQTLSKKQDHFRYVFIYKNLDTLRYAIFHGIFENGRGGHFYIQKKMHFALHFIFKKQCNLHYVVTYKHPDTMPYIFICKKQYTLRYIFISKIYCIVYSYN